MENFLDYAKITYFTPENAVFSLTKNGFPTLKAFIPPIQKDDLECAETPAGEGAGQKDTSAEPDSGCNPVWQDLGRIYFHRMFPFDSPDEFISVLDKDGKEYGVIRRISDFGSENAEIITRELDRKYLCPEITKIKSLKDKLGYTYWEVDTDKGEMSFSTHDTYRNIARISDTRLVISDLDGNRFSITDVLALDRKSYRKIELYL